MSESSITGLVSLATLASNDILLYTPLAMAFLAIAAHCTRPWLPRALMESLEAFLEETEQTFRAAEGDGLLPDPRLVSTARAALIKYVPPLRSVRLLSLCLPRIA